jgi:hypothetical protein
MAYEHLIQNNPIPRELNYGGKTETVYFRRLTAGERMQLKRGRKGSVKDGETSIEMDFADIDAGNHLLLTFAHCKEDGTPVFKTAKQVADLPASLVDALLSLCADAIKEDDSGN